MLVGCEHPGGERALLQVHVLMSSTIRENWDPFSDKSGNEDILLDWQKGTQCCDLFQLGNCNGKRLKH